MCLCLEVPEVSSAIGLCLCADHLSSNTTTDAVPALHLWWQQLVKTVSSQSLMPNEDYERLIARLAILGFVFFVKIWNVKRELKCENLELYQMFLHFYNLKKNVFLHKNFLDNRWTYIVEGSQTSVNDKHARTNYGQLNPFTSQNIQLANIAMQSMLINAVTESTVRNQSTDQFLRHWCSTKSSLPHFTNSWVMVDCTFTWHHLGWKWKSPFQNVACFLRNQKQYLSSVKNYFFLEV